MKAGHTLLLAITLVPGIVLGQSFTRTSGVLSKSNAKSGGCVGIADMDGDGYDDLILLDQSKYLYIDYQQPNGTFTLKSYGQVSSQQWGMTVGDVNGDGHKDFFSGASSGSPNFLQITGRGQSAPWTTLAGGSIFMQCTNMADINNDGHLDIYANNDVGAPKIWMNDGNGNMVYTNYIDFSTTPYSDMSGNYGSIWIDVDNDGDLDLFIAKCRQGVNDPTDPRRWNRLFINDGNYNFTDRTVEYGLDNRNQSWSADFGDIDNDGDLDLVITNHSRSMQLFLNDGTGHFTDATEGSGIAISAAFLQVKFVDLDNDGYLDLITSGNLGGSAEYYFHGNGDGTFTSMPNMLPEPSPMNLHTFAVGDMNRDGFIDIYAGYGSSYVSPSITRNDQLYLNNGNSNHFLAFNLRGKESNPDGVGARVTLYGPWGTQIREVRAGESYGIVCSFTCHFGLGAATMADSAIVRWPSGKVDKYFGLQADQWITVNEGETRASQLALKVLLDGPFDTASGLMRDDLRSQGLIPAVEPYSAMGHTSTMDMGTVRLTSGVLAVTGNNAIVDWVWLELRKTSNPAVVVAARPALLQRDGDVVDLDGKSAVAMGPVDPGSYHIAVRHRNHLGVMTSAGHAMAAAPLAIDLRSMGTGTWGSNARKQAGAYWTLWSGEVTGDAAVKFTGPYNDRDGLLLAVGGSNPNAVVTGYKRADVNMDGQVKFTGAANDRDPILLNIGGGNPTNVLYEQLP